jgi:DNA-binding transcriptional MerR regulator
VNREALSIGQVAAGAGVNVQTLRYYERRGILPRPARSGSGRRQYTADAIRLIRFIKRAQVLGFTLKEVEELIALRRTRARDRVRVRRLARARLGDVDVRIARLQAVRKAIAGLVEACDCETATLECPILAALDDPSPPPTERGTP